MARRKHRESLQPVLRLPGLFAIGFGSVGSSIYYALGIIALFAMGATPIVLLITGILFAATAASYAEATAALPRAGGAASFGRRAFNELVGFCAGWALLLDYLVLTALAAFYVPNYLAAFWPELGERPLNIIAGIIVVAVLALLNIAGLRQATWLSWTMTLLGLVTQVLLIVVGLILLFQPRILIDQLDFGVAPTWSQFLYAIPLGTVAYAGLDAVSNMAEEASQPTRDMPRAIRFLVPLVIVLYIGLAVVALSAQPVGQNTVPVDPVTGLTQEVAVTPGPEADTYVLADDRSTPVYVPVEQRGSGFVIPAQEPTGPIVDGDAGPQTTLNGTALGSTFYDDPVQGIVAALPDRWDWLRTLLRPWVAVLAAVILITAANAGIIGSSRMVYAMAQRRELPVSLSQVHPERVTPTLAIALIAIVTAALIIPADASLLADLYAFGAMIAYTIVHLSLIALRYREPRLSRPYTVPFNLRFRGGRLPLVAILGALGTAAVWVAAVATHPYGRIAGLSWVVIGLCIYVWYRRRHGYPLLRPVPGPRLPATAAVDVDYEQILVPIIGSRLSDEMMVLACQLATDKDASIHAVVVIEVPMNLPLDAPLEEERAEAEALLEVAATIPEAFGIEMRGHVLTARQAGRAIVELSERCKSQVIIIGAPRHAKIADRLIGGSVAHVLRNARCEVIVNFVPPDYPMRGSAAEVHDWRQRPAERG